MNAKLLSLAIALIGSAGLAHAELTTSASTTFDGSASVTAIANSVASATSTNNNAAIATVGVGQFDTATGVLTGATVQVDGSAVQSISGIGTKGNGAAKTANGSGSNTAGMTAPGAGLSFAGTTVTGTGCSLRQGGTGNISCNWGPVTSTSSTTGSTGVAAGSLDSYVGTGTTNVSLTLPGLQATSTLSSTMGQASSSTSTYTVNWSGSVQANYSYLLHAAPSFDVQTQTGSLTLDFGTVVQGSSAGPLAFTLYNLVDTDRVGLDLDSVAVEGEAGKFATDLAGFTNLDQGLKQTFQVGLDTSSVGSFSAHYVLTLSDADVGVASTRGTYQMELNLVGNVAAVPEPETYAMLLAGLGMIVAVARRRMSRIH